MSITHLGGRIRERRLEMRKTLKDIANETKLSVGFISQVERGITVPSLSSLATIAHVVGVSIGDLTGPTVEPQTYTHKDQRRPYSLETGPVKYERLSSIFPGSKIHSVKFTMPSGYRSETVSHDGEELVLVLRGRICYRVADEVFILNEGDSLHFDATILHSIEALPSDLDFSEVVWSGTLDLFGNVNRRSDGNDKIELVGTEFKD